MDKVTILGATGMLGSACLKVIPNAFHPLRTEFDALSSEPKFEGWVINCIGAIPQRINDLVLMKDLNDFFPKRLGESDAKVIQIATDCVFSGKIGKYSELDKPDPIDEYGKTKLAGEEARSLKIRCSIIGPDKSNASLFEWVRQQPEGATIYGYTDHFWNGVSTNVFANLAKGIIQNNFWEDAVLHFVPRDSVSKYELLKMIAKRTNRTDLIIVKKITGEKIDRTLTTINPELNKQLWKFAGYEEIPTIEEIVARIPI